MRYFPARTSPGYGRWVSIADMQASLHRRRGASYRSPMLTRALVLATCCVLGVVGAVHSPSLARAQDAEDVELFDYTVVEGDSCASISERFFGSRRRYDLIHAYNPGMGPPPHDLEPGRVLRLPRRAVSAESLADATVTGVERRVEARPRPVDESWISASLGLGLFRGGRVATQARSAAELTFRDTSVVQLREDTLVIIFGPSAETTRRAGMEATLETGALRTRLGELRGETGGNTLRVVTGAGTATLAGGSAVVSVDPAGTSRLSNHSSRAGLTGAAGGRPVTLPENTGSLVRRGERPTPPRPLPAAPAWHAGPRRFLAVAGLGGTLSGSWEHVTGAVRYRIELARRPDGREVVFAAEIGADVVGFQAHRLPAGTYYASLATLDAEGFESRPSAPERFELVEGRLLAPGDDPAAPAPAYDPGDPSVEPSPIIEALEGTLFVPPAGVRCDGAETPLLLREGETHTCNDERGESVMLPLFEVRRVRTVTDGVADDDERLPPTFEAVRGAPRTVVLEPSLEGGLPDDLTLVGGEGLLVASVAREGGRFTATIAPTVDAEAVAYLSWVRASTPAQPMGRVRVRVTEAPDVSAPTPVPAPAEVASPPRAPRLTEAYARSPIASALTLTDLDRRGSTVGLSLAEIAPRPRDFGAAQRTRLAIAGDLSLFDDALALGTLVPVDVVGVHDASWERGSLDVYAHVRWVPLRRDPAAEASLALALDVGAWFPTHAGEPSGLLSVRLQPSLEVAYAIERVLAFRTRQGAIVDLDAVGARLWASAYGLDLEVWGPFTIGVEIDLALGAELERGLFAVGLAPQLALDVDPVMLGLGMRFGLNRDGQDLFGAASVVLTGSVALR